jgi:WhiB family redox-sensing transcriptional regulator
LFFTPSDLEKPGRYHAREARAKAICVRCPVRLQCLGYALQAGEDHGIWGGLNEIERSRLGGKRGSVADYDPLLSA